MPRQKVIEFLDSEGVKYVSIKHSQAYTAQEVAASAHIPEKELAKTIMVKLDGKMAMAVLPASFHVDLEQLKDVAGVGKVELASEAEFRDLFLGSQIGAMPPFGNLYGMDVYVAVPLTEDKEIVFNAGSHTELIRLAYADFERLVKPTIGEFAIEG